MNSDYSWENNNMLMEDFPRTFKSCWSGKWFMEIPVTDEIGYRGHHNVEIEDTNYIKWLERTRKGTDKFFPR